MGHARGVSGKTVQRSDSCGMGEKLPWIPPNRLFLSGLLDFYRTSAGYRVRTSENAALSMAVPHGSSAGFWQTCSTRNGVKTGAKK